MIGFAGLSHLGIVSSITAASRGYAVNAYDPNSALCGELTDGNLPIFEPDLQDLFAVCRSGIRFTNEAAALKECELIFFSADVPTNKDNCADLSHLRRLIDSVAAHASPHAVLVILSQVPPGFTRRIRDNLRAVHRAVEMAVYYQVETLIFGRAVERALHPERIIVGCENASSILPKVLSAFLEGFNCPVLRVQYESAELAKISINVCLAASIGVANTLSELCEALGADWAEITPALRLDRRIGPHAYLTPGLGIGGGNLERDLVTASSLASTYGVNGSILSALVLHSSHRRNWVNKALQTYVMSHYRNPTLAIWGLSYKAGTKSTKNSPSLTLLESLTDIPVRIYDPQAELDGEYRPYVTQVSSPLDACKGADALVIMTAWEEFSAIAPSTLRRIMSGRVVIDPAAAWDRHEAFEAGFLYCGLGAPALAPNEPID